MLRVAARAGRATTLARGLCTSTPVSSEEAAFLVSSQRVLMFSNLHRNAPGSEELHGHGTTLAMMEANATTTAEMAPYRSHLLVSIATVLDQLGERCAARSFASEAMAKPAVMTQQKSAAPAQTRGKSSTTGRICGLRHYVGSAGLYTDHPTRGAHAGVVSAGEMHTQRAVGLHACTRLSALGHERAHEPQPRDCWYCL